MEFVWYVSSSVNDIYSFKEKDGNILNLDTLHGIGTSHATQNYLTETFSDFQLERIQLCKVFEQIYEKY